MKNSNLKRICIIETFIPGGNTAPQATTSTAAPTLSYSRKAPNEERARRPGRPAATRKQPATDEESSVSQKDACLYDLIRNGKSSLAVKTLISMKSFF